MQNRLNTKYSKFRNKIIDKLSIPFAAIQLFAFVIHIMLSMFFYFNLIRFIMFEVVDIQFNM